VDSTGCRRQVIRGGKIGLLLIDRSAPDSSDSASTAETVLPQDCALFVGIESMADA
jgi:hypothetical protein